MLSKLFSNRSTNIRRIIIMILFLGFFVFLYFFNQVERVELVNQKGTGFEKAVVEDVVKDNIQKDGSRVGKQDLKVRMLSGKQKGKILDATSFSGYLYGADCKEKYEGHCFHKYIR
ncbi:hypothetical protein [Clostridium arbusti]|uniref:hypothetical protein n=1 Tax=Clostridium arbusti TaxID=1137848 RepID=UPI00030F357E|nr:hypothetical protein [Clostridium arbusti]